MILARKINKIPKCLPKNARILHNKCPKNIFFRNFFWGPPAPRLLHLWLLCARVAVLETGLCVVGPLVTSYRVCDFGVL